MLKVKDLDEHNSFETQLNAEGDGPVLLGILFTMAPEDIEAFKAAWTKDAAFTKSQPGFISAQLHQGVGASTTFLDLALFDSVAGIKAMMRQPEFGPLRQIYPGSISARLHLFRRIAIPGICIGDGVAQ